MDRKSFEQARRRANAARAAARRMMYGGADDNEKPLSLEKPKLERQTAMDLDFSLSDSDSDSDTDTEDEGVLGKEKKESGLFSGLKEFLGMDDDEEEKKQKGGARKRKSKSRSRSKSYKDIKTVGSRREVWNGSALHTSGGLYKEDLMKNKRGEIVSKKKHKQGKKAYKNIEEYTLDAEGMRAINPNLGGRKRSPSRKKKKSRSKSRGPCRSLSRKACNRRKKCDWMRRGPYTRSDGVEVSKHSFCGYLPQASPKKRRKSRSRSRK